MVWLSSPLRKLMPWVATIVVVWGGLEALKLIDARVAWGAGLVLLVVVLIRLVQLGRENEG